MGFPYKVIIKEQRGDGIATIRDKAKITIQEGAKAFQLKNAKKVMTVPSAKCFYDGAYHLCKENDVYTELILNLNTKQLSPEYNPTMIALLPSVMAAIFRNTAETKEPFWQKWGGLIMFVVVAVALGIMLEIAGQQIGSMVNSNNQNANSMNLAAVNMGHIATEMQYLVTSGALHPVNVNSTLNNNTQIHGGTP